MTLAHFLQVLAWTAALGQFDCCRRAVEVEREMREPAMLQKLRKLAAAGLIGMEWRP